MAATNPILQVQNLDIRFRVDRKSEPFRAVKGISFDIPVNSTVALVGESGQRQERDRHGDPGLLPENAIVAPESRILYGRLSDLLKASMGQLQDIRGKDISVIFQEPMTSLNPVFTVGEQIAEVLRLHMGMTGSQAKAPRDRAAERGRHPQPAAAREFLSPRDVRRASSSA
jgi:peptide/nickel transport system ATP-binding protein